MKPLPQFISSLKDALDTDLPGKAAQYEMAAVGRPHYHTNPRNDIRQAAVLISLFLKEENWHTIVIKRKSQPGDHHAGQISFPGGKQEVGEVLKQTAVRESHEEVGTALDGVHVIGQLTSLHIPISNFMVHPFVGYLKAPPILERQESEVDEIFELPISSFMEDTSRQKVDLRVPEGLVLRNVPYFDIADQVVWGATAMIMSEFVKVVKIVNGLAGDKPF